ncbi:response regulator [Niastella caeni]|uniref:histidine kinase n=1 Tax=Niastella caeni TaxID=2569763 RepID=A0A4V4GZE8_9BACT|nr:two-component regulator propeller domain-containing protein [Niastella caeni]THU32406.1 response regulator [Niastella caeni]
MNISCRYSFVAILQLFFSCAAWAYTGPAISHLGIQQGLSNNSVQCIYQDHNGLMWFGTYDGLNSYDGYGFRVFRNKINDTGSIPHNYIYTIHEDKFNNLWVGTGQGVAVYDRIFDRFLPVYFHPTYAKTQKDKVNCSINTIRSDATGNVFIGANGWGLFLKKPGSEVAVQIPVKMSNNKESHYYNVQAIFVDKQEKVWLFIETVGLCLFDQNTLKIRLVNNTFKSVISMEVDGGHIWMGTDNGLYQYAIASNQFINHFTEKKDQLSANMVVSLCSDANNNLWVGTVGGGVNMLNKITGAFQYLLPGESKDQLSSESVYSIFVDKESRVWMGTLKGGIDILDVHKSRFQTITHNPFDANSLVNNFVSSFYEDKNGDLFIGTDGGGFSIWDRQRNTFTNFYHEVANNRSLSNNAISCIKKDHQGSVWIATFGGGINKFNRATGTFEHYKCINENTGEENKYVWQLYEDREQNFWATTFGNGKLYKLNRSQNRFELFDSKLNDLLSIAEDHTGALWVGNARQLICLDKQKKEHVYYSTGKPVRAIFEDSHHNLWVGTEGGGLILFNRKKGNVAKRYSTADGLSNNAVLNILEDTNGNLWISTFNGLSKFDPVKKTFQNFYQSDGLQSNQFSYNAALRLQSGALAFGGINGMNLFYPQQVNTRTFMPALLFSEIWVNNKPLAEVPRCIVRAGNGHIRELRIPYNEAILSFHFTALEYSSPEKVNYAYFLQGWDKDWNYTGNVRTINYNNISEGSYFLRIKSTNAEGIWNTREATIKIIILPPWYRTWWAYLLYIAVASAIIYIYYKYKARQRKLEYEIRLAHINAEKEKEINDKRHSFFTNISHEFRTPLTLIINPIKDMLRRAGDPAIEKDLTIVHRNAKRLLSLVDQLLIFRKADVEADKMTFAKHNFYNLCNEVYLCFVHQARTNHLTYTFDCNNPNLELYVDREKMEIILYNLISNAIKFTPPGGAIAFKVQETDNTVELSVQDTGCGIPAAATGRLFEKFYQAPSGKTPLKPGFGIGLYLVRHFIEEHKGAVFFQTTEGVGSTFFITLQKGKAHLANEIILNEAQKEPVILEELLEEPVEEQPVIDHQESKPGIVVTDRPCVLIADDDNAIRQYLVQILQDKYEVMEAENGQEALAMVQKKFPDLVISDIRMDVMDGIELCKKIKKDAALNHIPVVLLTGSQGTDTELQSIEEGADLYITKPFDKDLLLAKVENIFKTRNELRNYFFNEITLKQNSLKVSVEYKEFLENCIAIVERHLTDDNFTIKVLVKEIGMSHSNLYKKIRLLSGQSITNFIRYIRLRKAAELMLKNECNVNQAAFEVGISDIKYFRTQFNKLFGMNPSDYIKKYRNSFNNSYHVKGKTGGE